MAKVTRTLEVTDLTPAELVNAFAAMDSESQAEFFNWLAHEVKHWSEGAWPMQISAITTDGALDEQGREVMRAMGEA